MPRRTPATARTSTSSGRVKARFMGYHRPHPGLTGTLFVRSTAAKGEPSPDATGGPCVGRPGPRY
jgi:hypothetical protein